MNESQLTKPFSPISDTRDDGFVVGRTRRGVKFQQLKKTDSHQQSGVMPSLVCGWLPYQHMLFQSLS